MSQELIEALSAWSFDPEFSSLLIADGKYGVLGGYATLCTLCSVPNAEFLEQFFGLVCNCIVHTETGAFTLATLDATGALARMFSASLFLRPVDPTAAVAITLFTKNVGRLSADVRFVRKSFAADRPSGEALRRAALEGVLALARGGKGRPSDAVVTALGELAQQAEVSNNPTIADVRAMCRGCSKEAAAGVKLLKCAGCKQASYCGKECQKMDWKTHKHLCQGSLGPAPLDTSRVEKETKIKNNLSMSFVQSHVLRIRDELRRVAQASQASGGRAAAVTLLDLAVVVDFLGGAARGEFRVVLYADVKRRKGLPDWFYAGTEVYEANVAGFLTHADAVRPLMPRMLLFYATMHSQALILLTTNCCMWFC